MSDFPNAKTRNRILNELIEYCKYYNVPFEHVVDTMHALKVVPMIRGIGFEYVAEERLKEILPREFWKVEKPTINAQSAIQDIDVLITQISTGKKIQIECKLAGKDSFRNPKLGQGFIKVKCMRSRTVGEKAAKPLAKRYGVSLRDVLNHKDNYRDVDFDFVITSIGNAFWKTTDEGKYIFHLDDEEKVFLHGLFKDKTLSVDQLRSKTFDYLLIARSSALIASPQNHIRCRRKGCIKAGTSTSCGFIPNYPVVDLNSTKVWKPIASCEQVFENFLNSQ